MAKYEPLNTINIDSGTVELNTQHLPELVHLEDPAISTMIDFSLSPALTITKEKTMDDAITELKSTGAHCLLVTNSEDQLLGVIGKDDLFGEKPIKLLQESRTPRENITVAALMVPADELIAIKKETLKDAAVGHIVTTLQAHNKHYLLALSCANESNTNRVYGLFSRSQLRKQLHTEI